MDNGSKGFYVSGIGCTKTFMQEWTGQGHCTTTNEKNHDLVLSTWEDKATDAYKGAEGVGRRGLTES